MVRATALKKRGKVEEANHAEVGQRVAAVTLRASSGDPNGLRLYCRCRGVPVHNPGTDDGHAVVTGDVMPGVDDVMRLPLVMSCSRMAS